MRKIISSFLFMGILLFSSFSMANQSCFPIGRATHDRDCYDFIEKDQCLEKSDIYSCGWGKRKENPISDDEMLVCDSARCPNFEDGDNDLADDVE